MIIALPESAVAVGKVLQLVTIKNNFSFINYSSFAVFIFTFVEAEEDEKNPHAY